MMGLRLVEGISRPRLEALAERDVETLFGPRLPRLIEGGFLTLDGERLAATAAGRQRSQRGSGGAVRVITRPSAAARRGVVRCGRR